MKKLILPIVLALFGLGLGLGGGLLLRSPDAEHAGQTELPDAAEAPATDFVKMNNQFVVPVVEAGQVSALVILSLTLEVQTGASEAIYLKEPKLRDALLQVMFDHANSGGFKGVFTDGANLILLRNALTEAAQKVMGALILDVLIADISRQDS